MKSRNEILKWLRANVGKEALDALTITDHYALVASVALCNLLSYQDAPPELFEAYRSIVEAMQPQTRWLAYHAIACELNWSHRAMIWNMAGLPQGDRPARKCAFE